jgi:hypothetical protein
MKILTRNSLANMGCSNPDCTDLIEAPLGRYKNPQCPETRTSMRLPGNILSANQGFRSK